MRVTFGWRSLEYDNGEISPSPCAILGAVPSWMVHANVE